MREWSRGFAAWRFLLDSTKKCKEKPKEKKETARSLPYEQFQLSVVKLKPNWNQSDCLITLDRQLKTSLTIDIQKKKEIIFSLILYSCQHQELSSKWFFVSFSSVQIPCLRKPLTAELHANSRLKRWKVPLEKTTTLK